MCQLPRLEQPSRLAGLIVLLVLAGLRPGAAWGQSPAPASLAPVSVSSPWQRYAPGMAADPTHGNVVLFSGYGNPGGLLHDTWTWDGNAWSQASPKPAPPGRWGAALASDDAAGAVVLFGGIPGYIEQGNGGPGASFTVAAPLNDTWTWDGQNWTLQQPAVSPPGRTDASIAYDAATHSVVLFGGSLGGGPPHCSPSPSCHLSVFGDTWIWNGHTWTEAQPAVAPPARRGAGLAYDAATGKLLLFGGLDGHGAPLGDTWSWDGQTWTQDQPASSPSPRWEPSVAADPSSGEPLLFGGWSNVVAHSGYLGDTWSWDGSTWTQDQPASSPSPRFGAAVASDPAGGGVLLFGGRSEHRDVDGTWSWDGSTWEQRIANGAPLAPVIFAAPGAPPLVPAPPPPPPPLPTPSLSVQTGNAPPGAPPVPPALPSVGVPGQASLDPGTGVIFAPPPPSNPVPGPGGPVAPAFFSAVDTEIENTSAQPLNLGDNGGRITIAAPAGFAVQVLAHTGPSGLPEPFSGCAPVGSQANVVICTTSTTTEGGGLTLRLSVTLTDAGAARQRVSLPPRSAVALVGPAAAAVKGELPGVTVKNGSDQPAQIGWDGSDLTIRIPDGFAVAVGSVQYNTPSAFMAPDCAPADGQPNRVDCALTAIPPVIISFDTVVAAPAGTLTLPYQDSSGPGTLTLTNQGPDPAPGGASIAVSLEQNGVSFSGQGVLRPQVGEGDFLLAFTLSDSQGNSYLFESLLQPGSAGWSGTGLWLDASDPTQTDVWTAGAQPAGQPPFNPAAISIAAPSGPIPSPGLPLPLLAGSQLLGLSPANGGQFGPVEPPTVGSAGQALTFMAVTTAPCCGPGASQTYQWIFGDGSGSPTSTEQTASHSYATPGVYTVAVVVTDETGVSTFSSTQVHIGAAP